MGCWSETCAVTQTPIMHGDPIVLFFLTHLDNGNNNAGHTGSNSIWSPRHFPIYAKYDDYGGIEDWQENWNTEWIIRQFKNNIVEKQQGENEYHEEGSRIYVTIDIC